MPPEALAITHAQVPKMLKVNRKMAVPMRKTMNPTILNLMKRKSHFHAVSPKPFLAGLPMFITLKKLFHDTQSHCPYLSNQAYLFFISLILFKAQQIRCLLIYLEKNFQGFGAFRKFF